jgi:hypothetical protein
MVIDIGMKNVKASGMVAVLKQEKMNTLYTILPPYKILQK